MEIELKLLLDPADNARLLAHPLIAAHARGPAQTAALTAYYFDTPDLHFMRHRAGLRVRQMNDSWVQTMKAGGQVQSGLHQRQEWETATRRAWPQLGKLRKTVDAPWRALLDADGLSARLQVLFSVIVERTSWQLEYQDASIELVLDQGHIEHNTKQVAINEIELELKSGSPASLFEFALRLLDDIPLRLSNRNKAERGYALCYDMSISIAKAAPLSLGHNASAADALVAILSNCLEQIQGNEEGVLHSDAAESVHQMRVGLRRLRSALKLFGKLAPCPAALQDDIAWLGNALGAARDWEVLRDSTLPQVAGASLPVLNELVQRTAQEQRAQAIQALLSPRYTRLLLSLWICMQHASATADGPLAAPAAHFAQRSLSRLHKKMQHRADQAASGDELAVHRLRIAGKRARYAMEFFADYYKPHTTQHYLEALAAMQDALGGHNDVMVANRLMLQLHERQPEAALEVAFARGYLLGRESASASIGDLPRMVQDMRLPRRA